MSTPQPQHAAPEDAAKVSAWLDAGRVIKAHGVRGELRGVLDVAWESLAAIEKVRLVRRDEARVFCVEHLRPVCGGILLTVADVNDRQTAQKWSGATLQLRDSDVPPPEPGEYYTYELIDAAVVDAAGAFLGDVKAVLDNGGQALLSIATPAADRLLPLVPATIRHFNRVTRQLTVAVPAGLWDA